MANPDKLEHSFSIALILLLFSLLIFRPASAARALDASTFNHPAPLNKILAGEEEKRKNSIEENTGKGDQIKREEYFQANNRKFGLAYGPLLMNMLPKGSIPVSGPSRRINDANN